MIQKVLIANRGEIARRIIRTCKRLGIATVAVYSEADVKALYVGEADEAVAIGPPPVAQSYLNIPAILEAAKVTSATAVHPGYGLMSENADFAQACIDAGLIFIGPSPEAIRRMGSKVEARSTVRESGVRVVPGSDGPVPNADTAAGLAGDIGYPVMLKASYGGGGIGMQAVADEASLRQAFASNQGRAKAYFGNGEMFLEKQIVNPRHVEIQVLFDREGHGVHLGERECSIQRRHQKVVEEAPSTALTPELRSEMGRAAVTIGRAIGYEGAGTVEFLLDADHRYYFLEMNTRLQVEHPVTEFVTGLDLVELQLSIADGQPLPLRQDEIQLRGHAIECRIYAEDPVRMLPSPGTISLLTLPEGPGIRNDVGVASQSEVSSYYDPMIGKLITYGETRAEATARMLQALSEYRIEGIKSNLPLLQKIVSAPAFAAGEVNTAFIEKLLKD